MGGGDFENGRALTKMITETLPMPLPKKEKASPKHTVKIRKIDH